MKEISIAEILSNKTIIDPYSDDGQDIVKVIKDICNQIVDLCVENADVKEAHCMSICESCGGQIVDNESILKTKGQIK
jgi:hypothetical protein